MSTIPETAETAEGQSSDVELRGGLHDGDAQVSEILTSRPTTTTLDDSPNPEALAD
jgi:hypothetical protein